MRKLTVILILVTVTMTSAFSQLKFGVRGGLNFNNVKMEQQANEPIQISYDKGMGFHFGLTSQLQILNLYIQPEVMFSTVTNDVTLDDIRTNGIEEVTKQRFNKFDIPIQVGLKFGAFKIGAGPVATRVLKSRSDLLDKYEMQSSAATIGYQFGLGFDFDKFNIEMRWEGNLSNLGTGVKVGGTVYDFDQRMRQLLVTTAIYF